MRGKGLALLLAAVMAMQGSAVCVCAENEQSGASSEDAQAAVSVAEGGQDTLDEEALAGASSGVDDGVYVFSSGIRSDRVLDIAGASSQSGASLQLYEDNYSSAQKYRVTKNSDGRTYTIAPLCSDKVLDVAGGNKNSGAKVWQYKVNNSEAQKWTFISNRDGSYTVVSDLSGKVLDLYGASTSIGLKLQVYDYNGSKAQRFYLDPVYDTQPLGNGTYTVASSKDSGYVLDVSAASTRNGANVQIYGANDTNAQKFDFTYLGNGYYKIANANSNKALDVAAAGSAPGTNVQQYEWNGSSAQQWKLTVNEDGSYSLRSKCSSLFLDISGGICENGRNIQIYTGNGTPAQKYFLSSTVKKATTPFAKHGELQVIDSHLCDASGTPYQMTGISTHGIAWYPGYVNEDAFTTIRDSWNGSVVRLALYTEEYNGYLSGGDQNYLKNLIDQGVQAATDLGMYVIIDWHILSDGNPLTNESQAISFFDEMSRKYASYGNVLYEICNEPNGGTSWSDIRSYANAVIPVIRSHAKNAIIIVGTPNWSQYVDEAADSPLTGYSNIMYALHFYAATHKDELRNKLVNAENKGLPVFVTEYGICDASGSGSIDTSSAQTWINLLDQYGISYCAWNLSNKEESAALIRNTCSRTSGWSDSELSASGQWIVNMMRNH